MSVQGTRIAAIDIGSDTVHLLIAGASRDADGIHLARVEQDGELLELGRAVATDGRIGHHEALLTRTLDRYARRARDRADTTVIGATEALRRASDGQAVVDRLASRMGTPIRVLSGTREAALGLLGAGRRLDATGSQLLIDSGGASTELTVTDGRRPVASASLPVGASSLGVLLRGDPPEPLSWAMGAMQIGVALATAPPGAPARAWATGGTAHNLAALERGTAAGGDERRLARHDLDELAVRLLADPAARLARHSGEDPRRVAILPPGLLIIAAVLEHYGLGEVTVVPEGLRDGMIAAAFDLGDDWWRDTGGTGEGSATTVGAAAPS
jgi:exopolyphosphatase/guanosine-5'-triphosphate,3'-diphosphate pyrophosphatase